MKIYKYQTKKYNFTTLIENLFECNNLSKLHEKIPENKKYNELFKVGHDSSTTFHEIFYKKLNSTWVEFDDVYYDFVKLAKNIVFPNTDEVLYQKSPTFRVHLPNNLAVSFLVSLAVSDISSGNKASISVSYFDIYSPMQNYKLH